MFLFFVIKTAYSDACSNVRIYSRDTWGARRPKSSRTFKYTPVDLFFVHHSAGSRCFDFDSCATQVRRIQNYHMDITRTYVCCCRDYNYLIFIVIVRARGKHVFFLRVLHTPGKVLHTSFIVHSS